MERDWLKLREVANFKVSLSNVSNQANIVTSFHNFGYC